MNYKLVHKYSAISVKQATIGTVFTGKSASFYIGWSELLNF